MNFPIPTTKGGHRQNTAHRRAQWSKDSQRRIIFTKPILERGEDDGRRHREEMCRSTTSQPAVSFDSRRFIKWMAWIYMHYFIAHSGRSCFRSGEEGGKECEAMTKPCGVRLSGSIYDRGAVESEAQGAQTVAKECNQSTDKLISSSCNLKTKRRI